MQSIAMEPLYLQPHSNILCRNFPPDLDQGSFLQIVRHDDERGHARTYCMQLSTCVAH